MARGPVSCWNNRRDPSRSSVFERVALYRSENPHNLSDDKWLTVEFNCSSKLNCDVSVETIHCTAILICSKMHSPRLPRVFCGIPKGTHLGDRIKTKRPLDGIRKEVTRTEAMQMRSEAVSTRNL